MAAQHHASAVLLALLLALLPGKPADRPDEAEDADDQALGARLVPGLRLIRLGRHLITASSATARRRAGGDPGARRQAGGRNAAG